MWLQSGVISGVFGWKVFARALARRRVSGVVMNGQPGTLCVLTRSNASPKALTLLTLARDHQTNYPTNVVRRAVS